MTNDFEYVIVGAGSMGCAAAYHLARSRRSVLLLEQFEIGHTRGSSHGESRIIRLSYEQPTYIRLAQAAYRLWAELETDAGQKLVFRTGGLDLSAPYNPTFEACVAGLTALHVPRELLDTAQLRRRYAQFYVPDGTLGLYQGDAGILNPIQCVMLMAQRAAAYGAAIREHTPVRSIRLTDSGAQVATEYDVYQCRKLIISVGPWSQPFLQRIGIDLPLVVTQEQYAFFKPQHPDKFQPDQFPVFIHYGIPQDGQRIDYYGFPIFGRSGVKVGEHHGGPVVTADTRSFDVDPIRLQRLSNYVGATLPDTQGEVIDAATCLYTNTPDHHFVIDALPGFPHAVIASPCSGHGFKFSILIGRILAELAATGKTEYPLEMFALKRFG